MSVVEGGGQGGADRDQVGDGQPRVLRLPGCQVGRGDRSSIGDGRCLPPVGAGRRLVGASTSPDHTGQRGAGPPQAHLASTAADRARLVNRHDAGVAIETCLGPGRQQKRFAIVRLPQLHAGMAQPACIFGRSPGGVSAALGVGAARLFIDQVAAPSLPTRAGSHRYRCGHQARRTISRGLVRGVGVVRRGRPSGGVSDTNRSTPPAMSPAVGERVRVRRGPPAAPRRLARRWPGQSPGTGAPSAPAALRPPPSGRGVG